MTISDAHLYRRNCKRRRWNFRKMMLAGVLAAGCLLAGCKSKDVVPLALVTDGGGVDDQGYNQAAWEALQQYGETSQEASASYQPEETTNAGLGAAIDQALDAGADVVVCPGSMFETVVYDYQRANINIKYIILDGVPHADGGDIEKLRGNTHAVLFSRIDEGFLAGYAAVKEGYTNLGFMGSMSDSLTATEYGAGFVLGADVAAGEMGLAGQVQLRFSYLGQTNASPAITDTAGAWYGEGVQVIFSDNVSIINCVGKAASAYGTRFISIDEGGSAFAGNRLMNVQPDYKTAVTKVLDAIGNDSYEGGEKETLGLGGAAVSPSWGTGSLANFTTEQYQALVQSVQSGAIVIAETIEVGQMPETQNISVSVV